MKIIEIETRRRVEFIEITASVKKAVKESKIKEGICVIFSPHTTAGLLINENADPSVRKDIISQLEKLVPQDGRYSHLEGNADAHIKSSLLGNSLNLIIHEGELILGTWQGIYFCEFDGPRKRKVYLKLVSSQ